MPCKMVFFFPPELWRFSSEPGMFVALVLQKTPILSAWIVVINVRNLRISRYFHQLRMVQASLDGEVLESIVIRKSLLSGDLPQPASLVWLFIPGVPRKGGKK